ncbi:MAG: hypothetical protein JNIBNLAF_01856 [Nitrosomonas europaea]|nr:hypothetical protein [Nitrosomonas europaea]
MATPFTTNSTLQSVCKTSALKGCGKITRSPCHAPRHRRITTIFVALLAIIMILPAMRLMEDACRGSLEHTENFYAESDLEESNRFNNAVALHQRKRCWYFNQR